MVQCYIVHNNITPWYNPFTAQNNNIISQFSSLLSNWPTGFDIFKIDLILITK